MPGFTKTFWTLCSKHHCRGPTPKHLSNESHTTDIGFVEGKIVSCAEMVVAHHARRQAITFKFAEPGQATAGGTLVQATGAPSWDGIRAFLSYQDRVLRSFRSRRPGEGALQQRSCNGNISGQLDEVVVEIN